MPEPENELVFLWSTGEKQVALTMIFMYLLSAKQEGWWKEVTLIGTFGKAARGRRGPPGKAEELKKEGIVLEVCKACAEIYGVADNLTGLGIGVYYIGKQLTNYIKDGRRLLSL